MYRFWNREWQELRKRGLVWLLLLSCTAVTYVIGDQARTLEQQRVLIQVLQGDSMQLFAGRMQDLTKGNKSQENPEPGAAESPAQATPEPPKPAPPTEPPPHTFQPVVEPARVLRAI